MAIEDNRDKEPDIFPISIRTFKYKKNGKDLSNPDGIISLIKEDTFHYCIEIQKFLLGYRIHRKRCHFSDFNAAKDFFEEKANFIKNKRSIQSQKDRGQNH